MPREGCSELVDSATFLQPLTADHPGILRQAHDLGVQSRPQTSDQVLTIPQRITSAEAADAVRAAVTTKPDQ